MAGSWGEVPWGGYMDTEAETGYDRDENRTIAITSENIIIVGEE